MKLLNLAAACVLAQTVVLPPAVEVANPPLVIAVLGDSNSAVDPYFDQWWEYLGFLEPHWTVHCFAVSAQSAIVDGPAQALAAKQVRPDLVLNMLGTNDLPTASVAEIVAAWGAIEAIVAPAPVLHVGPLEIHPYGAIDPTAANAKTALLPSDVPLLGVLGPEFYKLPVDGLHLDGEGQRALGWLMHGVVEGL